MIDKVNGFFYKVGTPSINVGVSEQTALANALSFVNAKKYGWEDSFTQSLYRQQQKDSSATLYPKGKLVIFYDDSITHAYRLVYQFPVYAVQPLIDCNVYVDAISGSVIYRENLIEDTNTPGTATTLYSGVQNIVMDSYNTPVEYRLMETRPGPYGSAQIYTRNMHNTGTYGAWQEFNNATVNWNTPDGSLDVQLGTERVFDYWNTVRHRNSYDGSGGSLIGYVHANLVAMGYPNNDNAFWSSTMQVMTYGDGTTLFHQVTSLDVIAHEIGHGVCQHTANLAKTITNPEPDALNEGLSDIWGAVIEDWAALPNKQTWEIGENIMADGYPCLRSLQNPRTGGDPLTSPTSGYPDTYLGQFWYNANNVVDNNTLDAFAHTNSTVLSHWFYLLSVGGTGWNNGQTSQAPVGSGYQWNVNGIGITEAASIVWEAESNHLIQPSTNYAAIRTAMITAATDLFCANSPEVIAVTNAWHAVGVGATYSGNVMSISGQPYICTSNAYTVIHQPTGITSTLWSISNPSVATINTSGTATKVSNGSVYIYANMTGSAGCTTKLSTISIPVGITRVTIKDSATTSCSGTYQTWVLSAVPDYFGSNWDWTVGYLSPNSDIYINSFNASTTYVDVSGGGGVNLTYTDACGNNLSGGVTIYSTCHSGYAATNFTVAPNPAQNDITVSGVTNSNLADTKTKTVSAPNLIYGIRITDVLGTLRKSFEYKSGIRSIKVSVSDLNPGIYSLSVFDGEQWQSQNIIVQK